MSFARLAVAVLLIAPRLVAAASGPDNAPVSRIPAEAFFDRPTIGLPQVAPDGGHVAFLAPLDGRLSVYVFDLATGKARVLARAFDGDFSDLFWKGSDRVVFSGDPNGRESRVIYSASLVSGSPVVLAENWREDRPGANFGNLVSPLLYDPTHILVYGREETDGMSVGLFLINIITGQRSMVFGDDIDTSDWETDCAGQVRFRKRYAGGRTYLETRSGEMGRWKSIADFGGGYGVVFSTINSRGFAANNRTLYLTKADAQGREDLYGYDTDTGEWGAPLFQADTGPIGDIVFSWDRSRIEGINFGADARQTKWFDSHLQSIAATLRATFPAQYDITLASADRDEDVFIVRVHGDLTPGEYYVLDLRGKRTQLALLARLSPKIDRRQLQPMQDIAYTARDGRVIHGYLTLPRGAAGKRVPLIMHPHGGPYGVKDNWGYNPEVQFLANRGYAVLQPNFRGSGGYGEPFLVAGRHEWGRKMQDDLTDGVKWAIDQGIADPARVCIYGASYGGYAALAGAVYTPDLYCCAVNYVGVSDLSLISTWEHEEQQSGAAYYKQMVGDDRDLLYAQSPVNFVSRIKIPTLHAYGENDPRVVMKNWTELEHELKKYNKTYEYIYEGNEGHGFKEAGARINFYHHLEAFLDKYLAPPAGTP
jgi:dipeptidyl aminopeptidase/acylaminoacyl peptidase